MSRVIEVPPAGQTQQFSLTGLSLYIISSASYEKISDCPQISFDTSGTLYPGITRSRFTNPAGVYNRIFVTGTDESAGDDLTLLSLDVCVDDFINFDALATTRATLKPTFSETMDDTVFELTELQIVNSDGDLPGAMYITARGGAVAYAFDVDPAQADGLGHILSDQEIQKIEGINFIEAFRCIAAVATETPEISFTMEY